MALEVGLIFGGGIELWPEWAVFPVWAALFMADLVVEALGKPHNCPFWLHGNLRPWFRKALASKASLSPLLPVWVWLRRCKWQPKGQRSFSAILSSIECVCDLNMSQERIFGAAFLVSVL